jgi:two-component system, LytTR family, response regulator
MKKKVPDLLNRINQVEDIIVNNNVILTSLMENQIALETHLQSIIKSKHHHTIAVNGASKIDFIPINEILYCKANLAYTDIISKNNNNVISTKPINDFEESLSNHSFFRISKSLLINTRQIHSYNKRSAQVLMKNKDLLDVARRRKTEFLSNITL